MPWKESSVMEERLRFVARLLDGEEGNHPWVIPYDGPDASSDHRHIWRMSAPRGSPYSTFVPWLNWFTDATAL